MTEKVPFKDANRTLQTRANFQNIKILKVSSRNFKYRQH